LKNLIIFYPSYERGGATKILINLIKFFLKKKQHMANNYSMFLKKTKYAKSCLKRYEINSASQEYLNLLNKI